MGESWRGKKASGGWESVEEVEEDRESSLALVHNGAEQWRTQDSPKTRAKFQKRNIG